MRSTHCVKAVRIVSLMVLGGFFSSPNMARAGRTPGRHPGVINSPGEPKIDPSNLLNYRGFPNLGRVQYGTLKGKTKLTAKTLFGQGATRDDVRMGREADCDAMATISAMADRNPESIRQLFKWTKDGKIALDSQGRATLILHQDSAKRLAPWSAAHPGDRMNSVEIPVSAQIPLDKSGTPVFSKAAYQKMWAPIVEKGLADFYSSAHKPGYRSINTGEASSAMEALTGKPAEAVSVRPTRGGADAIYERIKEATKAGQIIVGATSRPGTPAFAKRLAEAKQSGLISSREEKDSLAGEKTIRPHDYSIFGVKTVKGQRFVELRNPWGHHPTKRYPMLAGTPRNKRGASYMPVEKFAPLFPRVYIGGSVL